MNKCLKIISVTGALFCLGKRIDCIKELQAAVDVFKVFDTGRDNCNNNNNNNDHDDFYGDASDYDKGTTLEVKKVVKGGAEERHVFHIRIILFILNTKKSFNYTKKKVF